MAPASPIDVLGSHAAGVRDLLVEVVRSRHERAAEAHQVSGSRNAMGFGTQWRDLLEDVDDALKGRGFASHKLTPGGHRVPIVNDCLVYVWRMSADTPIKFASSPTRKNLFATPPPPQTLLDFLEDDEPLSGAPSDGEFEAALMAMSDNMPVVLVMVQSSPRQLLSIEWGVGKLDGAGSVVVQGQESIWEPELVVDANVSDVESFDSGAPVRPAIELRNQEQPSDA